MGKVIFSIKYEIQPNRLEEYISIISELKALIKADGLESYSAYQFKNKKNTFEEVYIFSSEEAYDEFDDNSDKKIELLMNKLSDIILDHTTEYNTLFEVPEK